MRNLNLISNFRVILDSSTWLSSNEEFEYATGTKSGWKNLNLIIFQWGIWMYKYLRKTWSSSTWLSSNEEFEFATFGFDITDNTLLIIFQWGIWIKRRKNTKINETALDYLPMRNLNIVLWAGTALTFLTWLSSNEEFESKTKITYDSKGLAWLSSNEEFEFINLTIGDVLITILDYLPMRNLNLRYEKSFSETKLFLDYLPMRNLNITTKVILILTALTWLSSNEEFEYNILCIIIR